MEFQLINQELSEARLFRSSRNFGSFAGADIANMLYLNTLSVYLMSEIAALRPTAQDYAKKTAQHGGYALFRTQATDIYMLAYQVMHPNNDYANLRDPVNSKQFLDKLQFADKRHIMFMRSVSNQDAGPGYAHTFMQRLESQLRITDSRYKSWRREITGWDRASSAKQKATLKKIAQETTRLGKGTGRGSELLAPLQKTIAPAEKDAVSKPSVLARAAGVAAGAATGRKIASRIKDTPTSKNIGTGIGAIAGYWAGKSK